MTRSLCLSLACGLFFCATAVAGTIRGNILDLKGDVQSVQNLSIGVTLSGTGQPVRFTVVPGAIPNVTQSYSITIADADLRNLSRNVKGRVDVRVSVEFQADGQTPATLTNISGTSNSVIDVVMPKENPCHRRCRLGLFGRRHCY